MESMKIESVQKDSATSFHVESRIDLGKELFHPPAVEGRGAVVAHEHLRRLAVRANNILYTLSH